MKPDAPRFALGGFEIVELAGNRPVFQVPIELWTDGDRLARVLHAGRREVDVYVYEVEVK